MIRKAGMVFGTMVLIAHGAAAQYTQEGPKLVGTGAVGPAHQGYSAAISADGNTAIVGGYDDNTGVGAAWVFIRSGGVWTQQANKLVGNGVIGDAHQGISVSLSADGDTAIVGGYNDNSGVGAAWIFTRSGGVWMQQGDKLVGTGAVGAAHQGLSVAMAGDGSTAIVGGRRDNSNIGAAWVFKRVGGTWSQQRGKLVGTGAVGSAGQGESVAIAADGKTAVVGGYGDDSNAGAAWVFTRSGGVWSQLGSKLVGDGTVDAAFQGTAVAIAADGGTVIVGGPGDDTAVNGATGAAWIYTRNGDGFFQQGNKLVGTGASGRAGQGFSVSISADGNTAIVGGMADDSRIGAAWVFTRSGASWSQLGNKLVGSGGVGSWQGRSAAMSASGGTAIVGGSMDDSETGAAWVFVSESTCDAPSITVQPQSQSIDSGQSVTLAVVAAGTVPLSFQWYQGASGDVSQPVGGNASTLTTPALTATTSFWVRVSNTCGSTDSSTATVTVTTVSANVVWVPVGSHASGLNDSQWRTDLGLLNTGNGTANVEVRFHGPGVIRGSTTYVPSAVQSILTDVVGELGGEGSGALEILSSQPVTVTSRIYNQVSSEASCYPDGTQGQAFQAVTLGEGLTTGQTAWLPQLTENSAYRSNIGVTNMGTTWASITIELYNGAGALLTTYHLSVAPGQWIQDTQPFMNRVGLGSIDRGYARVRVTAGAGVIAYASVVDNITNDPTTVMMVQ